MLKKGVNIGAIINSQEKKTSIELKRAPVNIWATVKMSTDLCPQAVELWSPAFWRGSWSRPGLAWSPSGPRWSVCPLTAPGSWGPAETPLHHPSPICLIHGSIIYTMKISVHRWTEVSTEINWSWPLQNLQQWIWAKKKPILGKHQESWKLMLLTLDLSLTFSNGIHGQRGR